MWNSWQFYFNAVLLGVGLAMDACAVSMANGLNEPKMKVGKITLIAAAFGFFQALMPLIGWVCVHYMAEQFEIVNTVVPYVALALLAFIGGKMIFEGLENKRKQIPSGTQSHLTNNDENTATGNNTCENASAMANDKNVITNETLAVDSRNEKTHKQLTLWILFTQAIATSIDALSVGFTISNYNVWEALFTAGVIAVITFAISFGAVFIGKKFGTKLGNKAEILGGCILIAIGLEIFVTGVFF